MTVLDEPTSESLQESPAVSRQPHERRIWPWLVGAAVILLVVLLVLIGLVLRGLNWADHYQPLVVGSSWGTDAGGTQAQELSPPGSVMTPYDFYAADTGSKFLIIDPKPGQKFWFRTELNSRGHYPVKVLHIATGFACCSYKPVTEKVYITSPNSGLGADFANTSAFKPFVLDDKTNLGRGIKIVFTVPSCAKRDATLPPEGTLTPYNGNSISSYQVTYKFLWFTRTVDIPLPEQLEIINLPLCPNR
jgi:hypothetical protein